MTGVQIVLVVDLLGKLVPYTGFVVVTKQHSRVLATISM